MAKVIESQGNLILQLSFWEKLCAFHNSLSMDKKSLVEKSWQTTPGDLRCCEGLEPQVLALNF